MLNLQICTVIIMTKKNIKKEINKKNRKKKKKKKNMRRLRFEPGTHGFKIHVDIPYAIGSSL